MTTVGVFVNDTVESARAIAVASGVSVVQLHGDEGPDYADALGYPVFRSVTLDEADHVATEWPPDTLLLLDATDRERRGGTGRTVDWARAAGLARQRRVILAGGLTPENVAGAIERVEPHGVDVSSGVEAAAGIKDAERVSTFLENARAALGKR